jgi:hypothetical protein
LPVFAGGAKEGLEGGTYFAGLAVGVGDGLGELAASEYGGAAGHHDLEHDELMDVVGVVMDGGVVCVGVSEAFEVVVEEVLEQDLVFGLFVGAFGAGAGFEGEYVFAGKGASVPIGAVGAAGLEAALV